MPSKLGAQRGFGINSSQKKSLVQKWGAIHWTKSLRNFKSEKVHFTSMILTLFKVITLSDHYVTIMFHH
jgi:hypothetical protein